ncbi:MAG: hypothetical protein H6713_40870 [Myxococcales bacterium]|nr:hypothetical protein [Myxococcales bacterium]
MPEVRPPAGGHDRPLPGSTLPTGTGDATGTGTDSDSDSDSDRTGTRGGETTTGPCLVPPLEGDATAEPDRATRAAAPKRPARAVIERVLSASALPDDVVVARSASGSPRRRSSACRAGLRDQ